MRPRPLSSFSCFLQLRPPNSESLPRASCEFHHHHGLVVVVTLRLNSDGSLQSGRIWWKHLPFIASTLNVNDAGRVRLFQLNCFTYRFLHDQNHTALFFPASVPAIRRKN